MSFTNNLKSKTALLKSVEDKISNLTGKASKSSEVKNKKELPWSNKDADSEEKAFFEQQNIDETRWNKLFPYRLVVIDITTNKIISGSGKSAGGSVKSIVSSVSGLDYVLNQEVTGRNWIANLPITPQQLQITDQYAINTTATMRGVVDRKSIV